MNNKSLQINKSVISPVISAVKDLKITNSQSLTEATLYLSQANKYLDSVIEYKEKKTKPLNELLKVIRAETKPLETALEETISTLRDKMSSYQTKALQAQKQAEEKIAAKLSNGTISLEKAVQKMEQVNVSEKIETVDGSVNVKFNTITKIEVMDVVLLANSANGSSYLLPDMSAIRKAYTNGIKLPGVDYREELSVRNNRK